MANNSDINDFQARLKSDVLKTIATNICDDPLILLCILQDNRLANAVKEIAMQLEPIFIRVNITAFVLSIEPDMTWDKAEDIWEKAKFKNIDRKSIQDYARRFWRQYKTDILTNQYILSTAKLIKEDCESFGAKATINHSQIENKYILNAFKIFTLNIVLSEPSAPINS